MAFSDTEFDSDYEEVIRRNYDQIVGNEEQFTDDLDEVIQRNADQFLLSVADNGHFLEDAQHILDREREENDIALNENDTVGKRRRKEILTQK